MKRHRILTACTAALLAAFAVGTPVATLAAQVTERPAPFDTAGQVLAITPQLAARLSLTPPAWPVTGAFVEARLFDLGNGRFVISVQRAGGIVERYELSADARTQLQRAVTAGLAATGTIVSQDRQDTESESASSAFVRNQTILGLTLYASSAASLADGGAGSGALYLATAGATFFTSLAIARNQSISKAQNALTTDGAWRGALIGLATKYALSGDDESGSANAGAILVGGLVGSTLGFRAGRSLTSSEARAATFGSTFATLTAAGIIATLGGFQQTETIASDGSVIEEDVENRTEVAGLVGAALAGYPLGLRYARRAAYGVTAGDIGTLTAGGAVGTVAASILIESGTSDEAGAAILTAGYVLGTFFTDRAFAKPYDFTEGEGRLVQLGALAGGLAAIAIPTLAKSDDGRVYSSLGALGGLVGMALTRQLLNPTRVEQRRSPEARDGTAERSPSGTQGLSANGALSLTFHPENIATLFALPRGRSARVPLATLRF